MIACIIVGIVVTVLASDNYPLNYRFTVLVGITPLVADSLNILFKLFVHRVFDMVPHALSMYRQDFTSQ
jgi:hypothetical protein